MYSPHDLLPAPLPSSTSYPPDYFYNNVAKHLIKDTVRIMANGLTLDMTQVAMLESQLDTTLASVEIELANHPYVQSYLQSRHQVLIDKYIEDRKSKLRDPSYYHKPFNSKDPVHRSYFMYIYANNHNMDQPSELYPTGIPKWPAKTVKALASNNHFLSKLVNHTISPTHPIALQAVELLAKHKAEHYNKSYLEQIESPIIDLPPFNPNSSLQKRELFESLGIPSDKTSKDTGLPSYDRDEIERIQRETRDPLVQSLCQLLIDNSFAAIVRSNFIEAFYTYSVDGRLYGNLKLLGAKSARYTSSNPNLLNMPSTGSIFAKPIKKCFTADVGFLVATADFSALEDRVIANLSQDTNKLGLFLEGLDGHSLSATYYYPQRVAEIVGPYTDHKHASRILKQIVDDDTHPKHTLAKEVRQDSKPISFGLAYGAFPPKVAATVKIPLDEAEEIFNAYHNQLYPGITEYREGYVLPTALENGQIHLGLGFTLQSDNPEQDIRTLNNACSQFWSILTLLTINKMHQLIDEAGLSQDIYITSSIYDSIYFEVRDDPKIIQWLNNNLIPVMEQDFIENQIVHNSVDLEIGTSWANLVTLPHNADIETIQSKITQVKASA